MATYEEIYGKRVEVLETDPTLTSSSEGQVWYNSTSATLKTVVSFGAWSSGSPFLTVRGAGASLGTQTAAVYATGYTTTVLNLSEEYNGSGWTTSPGNCNTARKDGWAGAGSQTAGLIFGGQEPGQSNKTESYNGSTWTAQGVLNTARHLIGGTGTLTAGLATGGNAEPPAPSFDGTEEFGGSSWTTGNTLNTGRQGLAACGPQTAALAYSGYTTAALGNTESYDGTSWTNVNAMPVATRMGGSAGDQTAALAYGGYGTPAPTKIGTTQEYDGTNWSTSPATLATSRYCTGIPAGTSTAALALGNFPETDPNTTEEFHKSVNTITAGAWATGGTIPEAKRDGGGQGVIGTVTSGLAFGGEPISTNTFKYDGSTWTATGALNTGRRYGGGFGPSNSAAGVAGGNTSAGDGYTDAYETFDGSSWTTSPHSLNTSRRNTCGAGTITAALVFGGQEPPNPTFLTASEEYDGEGWNTGNSMPVAKMYMGGGGTQTAAISAGGQLAPYPAFTGASTSEQYDGTSWTGGPSLLEVKLIGASSGTSTAFMFATGKDQVSPEQQTTQCQLYDGTAWATAPNVSTSMAGIRGSGGPSTAAFWGGGYIAPGASSGVTEQFTAETSAVTAKTLSTS